LVIGLFPEWFAPRQPDWPQNLLLPGFPHYDTWQVPPDRLAIEAFLNEGPAPLVFSQASLLKDSRVYFNRCAEIAHELGRRAILLTANPECIPDDLPEGVRSFGFVPLSEVLPRSAAFIHHGGLGSIAQGLAAGIPQVTIPRFLDQPDNSRRLLKLGVSDNLRQSEFRRGVVAPRIKALLDSPSVVERCRHYAALSQSEDAFARTAETLEQFERRS
jgi:UDP:flavonoid glycosyltransferase YjiC (YdhE family)